MTDTEGRWLAVICAQESCDYCQIIKGLEKKIKCFKSVKWYDLFVHIRLNTFIKGQVLIINSLMQVLKLLESQSKNICKLNIKV